jgi:hypothetical protein
MTSANDNGPIQADDFTDHCRPPCWLENTMRDLPRCSLGASIGVGLVDPIPASGRTFAQGGVARFDEPGIFAGANDARYSKTKLTQPRTQAESSEAAESFSLIGTVDR